MSDIDAGEWRRRAYAHRQFLDEHLQEIASVDRLARQRLAETQKAREAARLEAAAKFLPSFDPVSLDLCERLAGLPPGWAAQQRKRVQDEDNVLAVRIAQIENDEKWQRREALIGHAGEWTGELDEAEKALAPHQRQVEQHEALPSFKELIETGYGTPEYEVKFYNFRYYRLWKHADEACEKLGQEPFGLVRQLYLQEVERRDQRKAKRDAIKTRVVQLQRLANEHDAKQARREALRGPAPLEDSRKLVADWLGGLNRRALADMLRQAGRPDLLNAVLELDGIEAKSAYLETMLQDDLTSDLQAERDKLDNDIAKYGRPKKAGTRFPLASVQKRFESRPERYRRRLEQRRVLVDRIYDWDDWDYVDYDEWGSGVPWWFVFSGRPDPGYGARFGDVGQWSNQHPGWTYARTKRAPSSAMDDAAAALAHQQVDDGGRDVS